jgi:hypothetical protein
LYIFLLFCLLSLSFLSCFRNCFLLNQVLNRSDSLVAFGETTPLSPFLVSPSADLLPCGHRDSSTADIVSLHTRSAVKRLPLFPLYFHDIDDIPAIRALYSWLLCIIHCRPSRLLVHLYACHEELSRRSGLLQQPASYSWSTS